MGGEVPVIEGALPVSIPEGPVHTVIAPSDEMSSKSEFNTTVQVEVTSTPVVMGLIGSLVTVTEVGSDTSRVEKNI